MWTHRCKGIQGPRELGCEGAVSQRGFKEPGADPALLPVLSQAGDPVGGHHSTGEARHAVPARCDQSEHTVQWAFLLRVSQHQRDLQVNGAARQHSHEAALRQRGIRARSIPAQAEKEVS